jgi:hypothetical protein
MPSSYYKPSGRLPLKTFVYAMLFSLAVIPFAWLYAWLTVNIPFIYVNFFIALGFAIVLGCIASLAAEKGKARHPMLMGLTGAAIGVFGWHCQWAIWSGMIARDLTMHLTGRGTVPGVLDFALDPQLLYSLARTVNDVGIWKIRNATLNGFWLSAAWIIEFLMLVAVPWLMGRMQSQHPFCETSNSWAEKLELPKRFAYIADKEKFIQAVESSPGELLSFLPDYAGDGPGYAKLTLYRCQGTENSFVSVSNTTVKIDNGKEKSSDSTVIEYLKLPRLTTEDIVLQCAEASGTSTPASEDSAPPDSPELEKAIEALQAERFLHALEQAMPFVAAPGTALRNDANRICALASSRLEKWDSAFVYWLALFEHEPTAHNALQIATSSVIAGHVPRGEEWIRKADQMNETDQEMSPVLIRTNFITALRNTGHMHEALPYLNWVKGLYESLHITDATFLAMRGAPFFSAFLDNSEQIVKATMPPVQAHEWYASMLEHLDQDGKNELAAWLEQHMQAV